MQGDLGIHAMHWGALECSQRKEHRKQLVALLRQQIFRRLALGLLFRMGVKGARRVRELDILLTVDTSLHNFEFVFQLRCHSGRMR